MKSKDERKYKRRVEERTDYRARLRLLRSRKARLIVRRSNKNIRAQVITYSAKGDEVVASAVSTELIKLGWTHSRKNLPAAYLTGMLCATRAIKNKKTEAVLDLGLARPLHGTRVYAALKGAVDGGLQVPHNESALPPEDRLKGAHIKDSKVSESFESVKKKIGGTA